MNDNNQLTTINQNAKSALIKSKNLLDITKKILDNKKNDWVEKLIGWANEKEIFDFERQWDLNNVMNDFLNQIFIYVKNKEQINIFDDVMFRQRLYDALYCSIDKIKDKKSFNIELPFASMTTAGPFHLMYKFNDEDIEKILERNSTKYKVQYGIPRDKNKLLNLKYLNLEWCNIMISPLIFNLKDITKLNLKYNRFSRAEITNNDSGILENIDNFTELIELYLGNLGLSKIPESICNIKKLEVLVIENNFFLKSIPNQFINLKNLRKLDLKKNPKLILTNKQKQWILDLEQNGCDVEYDKDLFERNIIHNNEEIDEDEILF